MFKKGQIANLKNVFIISLVLIALVAVVLFFNKTTGFVWGIDSAKDSSGTATVSSEDSDLIALGDPIAYSFFYKGQYPISDGVGTLTLDAKSPTIETSLTSAEDDYQTDVVMEVARDSIKYTLNNPISLKSASLEKPVILNLLGQKIMISKVLTDTSLMIGGLNGGEVRDGDAFFGEDLDDPNWVWNLENLNSNNPIIGVENDFIWNDDSDNPAGVGECIYLPSKLNKNTDNYASICFDGLNVKDSEYDTYTIELDHSFKLNNVFSPAVHIYTKGKKVVSEINSKDIWITGGGNVYYKDTTNAVKYWKNILSGVLLIGGINPDLILTYDISNNNLYIKIISITTQTDSLVATFKLGPSVDKTSVGVISFGEINSLEEPSELTYSVYGKDALNIGTKDEDHRTSYGIIIRDPKAHGSSDEVVLDIPRKQVRAKVSVKFNEISVKEPETPTEALTKQQKKEVLEMLSQCKVIYQTMTKPYNGAKGDTCNQICSNNNLVCIEAFAIPLSTSTHPSILECNHPVKNMVASGGYNYQCVCCSAT